MDKYRRGELLNALTAAAYAGRIDRRTFLDALLKAGVASATAVALADHAAQAAENQERRRADLRARYDYVIVGAGSAPAASSPTASRPILRPPCS
jgi:choline dehydrogenase